MALLDNPSMMYSNMMATGSPYHTLLQQQTNAHNQSQAHAHAHAAHNMTTNHRLSGSPQSADWSQAVIEDVRVARVAPSQRERNALHNAHHHTSITANAHFSPASSQNLNTSGGSSADSTDEPSSSSPNGPVYNPEKLLKKELAAVAAAAAAGVGFKPYHTSPEAHYEREKVMALTENILFLCALAFDSPLWRESFPCFLRSTFRLFFA